MVKICFNGNYCTNIEREIKGAFYNGQGIMGTQPVIALLLLDEEGIEDERLTVGFGEFIGQTCCTYVNANTIGYKAEKVITENGLGVRYAPFTKRSGFCEYPLYIINPYLLEKIYEKEELADYLGNFEFTNEHILTDEELAEKISELKESYDSLCKSRGITPRHDFDEQGFAEQEDIVTYNYYFTDGDQCWDDNYRIYRKNGDYYIEETRGYDGEKSTEKISEQDVVKTIEHAKKHGPTGGELACERRGYTDFHFTEAGKKLINID